MEQEHSKASTFDGPPTVAEVHPNTVPIERGDKNTENFIQEIILYEILSQNSHQRMTIPIYLHETSKRTSKYEMYIFS